MLSAIGLGLAAVLINSCDPSPLQIQSKKDGTNEVQEPGLAKSSPEITSITIAKLDVHHFLKKETIHIEWDTYKKSIVMTDAKENVIAQKEIIPEEHTILSGSLEKLIHVWPPSEPAFGLHGDIWELTLKEKDGKNIKAGQWSSPFSNANKRKLNELHDFCFLLAKMSPSPGFFEVRTSN